MNIHLYSQEGYSYYTYTHTIAELCALIILEQETGLRRIIFVQKVRKKHLFKSEDLSFVSGVYITLKPTRGARTWTRKRR